MRSAAPRVAGSLRAPRARTFPPAPGGRQPLNFGDFGGGSGGTVSSALARMQVPLGLERAGSGVGWAAGEAGPPVALAGCRARAPAPAARLLSRAPGVGSGREAGPRVLAPRAPRRAERERGGGAANRRGGPVRAPRRLSAGWDRSAACDSATPRPRAPRPAPAGEPPSPVGSRPVCRGAAHRSPRVAARRWHPTPTSDPGLGAGASEGPGGRCAPGACWGSRPGFGGGGQ